MKKNILIIGGSSFIGRILIQRLLKHNKYNIYSTYYKNPLKYKNICELYLNLNNFKLKDLGSFPKRTDYLIILSWIKLNDYYSKNHKNFSKKLFKFISILMSISKIKSVNVLGSCLEYGIVKGKVSENNKCHPQTEYGKSKLYLLNQIKKIKEKYNFKLNWMRIFYLYGDTRDRGIWSQFLKSKNDKSIFRMSGGQQNFDFLHINTIIRYILIVTLSNNSNGIVNICSGRPKKLINLVKTWSKKYNVKLDVGFYPYTNYESMSYWGDNNKIDKIYKEHKNIFSR